mmetsp:Transcript_77830/g.252248  ORF Transcript_77830/g.252248 Transcript_77830/m.252248 type:complete len:209 (-) Transcript_77830:250-876(-)
MPTRKVATAELRSRKWWAAWKTQSHPGEQWPVAPSSRMSPRRLGCPALVRCHLGSHRCRSSRFWTRGLARNSGLLAWQYFWLSAQRSSATAATRAPSVAQTSPRRTDTMRSRTWCVNGLAGRCLPSGSLPARGLRRGGARCLPPHQGQASNRRRPRRSPSPPRPILLQQLPPPPGAARQSGSVCRHPSSTWFAISWRRFPGCSRWKLG